MQHLPDNSTMLLISFDFSPFWLSAVFLTADEAFAKIYQHLHRENGINENIFHMRIDTICLTTQDLVLLPLKKIIQG